MNLQSYLVNCVYGMLLFCHHYTVYNMTMENGNTHIQVCVRTCTMCVYLYTCVGVCECICVCVCMCECTMYLVLMILYY